MYDWQIWADESDDGIKDDLSSPSSSLLGNGSGKDDDDDDGCGVDEEDDGLICSSKQASKQCITE